MRIVLSLSVWLLKTNIQKNNPLFRLLLKLFLRKKKNCLSRIGVHDSGYRCFKHFYLEKVCKHLRHLFPKVVSYNRLVELERKVAIPLTLFIKKVLLGKCTGISFVDSTPLRVCRNQRIHIHKYCCPVKV